MEPPVTAPLLVAPVTRSTKPAPREPEPIIVLEPLFLHTTSAKIAVSAIKTINIFDFDGTLFRSPSPSYSLWAKESIGKLKSEPTQGGLGWYQDVATLSEPYVPMVPDDKWWINHVVDEVRKSIASDSCITVLLTGRTVAYLELMVALLQRKGLCFDYTLLKPLGGMRTFDFKRAVIRQLLKLYPNTSNIHIHEDREEHAERFRELVASLKPAIEGEVHMVTESDTVLPKAQELALATALLARYAQGQLEMVEQAEYCCVLLDAASHALLRARFPGPQGWHYRAHHMTISMGPLQPSSGTTVGAQIALSVVGIGRSALAFAVKVQCAAVKSANAIPHITIAFAPEGHAKDSNDIKEWRDATDEEKMELSGTVTEMKKWNLNAVKRVSKPPPGVNIGALVRAAHPSAAGQTIGAMVKQLQTWIKERPPGVLVDEAAITAFIKDLPSPSSPASSLIPASTSVLAAAASSGSPDAPLTASNTATATVTVSEVSASGSVTTSVSVIVLEANIGP